jgi:multimeric flavodoxin WrbA
MLINSIKVIGKGNIMKITAIGGSPRKGNSEWMLERLSEHLKNNGTEVDILLLRRLHIRACTGCLKCEDRKGQCRLNDEMNSILARVIDADAVVLATPVYFEMLSGLLKNFLDRTCPIWTHMKGKPLAGLAVAEEGIGQAMQNLKTYCKVCGMRWVGGISILAKNPGDAAQKPGLDNRLHRLAKKIVTQ